MKGWPSHCPAPAIPGAAGQRPVGVPIPNRDPGPLRPGPRDTYHLANDAKEGAMASPNCGWSGPSRVVRHLGWRGAAAGAGVVLVTALSVLTLRVLNAGPEPEGRNWWIATELILALAYL